MDDTRTGTRERKVLWHALCVTFIVLASLLLFYKHFLSRGMLMHVDMTFPTTIDRNLMLYSHTWWQYGSVQNIWNVQRVFWAYPLLGLAKVTRMPTEIYLLSLFAGTVALAGVSMYTLAFDSISRFFQKNETEVSRGAIYAGSVFAALIFMYNPFSVSHLWPYFGYPGYAALPLVFLLLVKTIDRFAAWKVVLLAVVITVAGTGPINVVWYWVMIVGFVLFYAASKKFDRKSLSLSGKVLLPLAGLYALLNAVWLVPYAGAQAVNKTFTPVYANAFSRDMLDLLSKSGTILNNVRFTTGWGMPVDPNPKGTVWIVLSFALPVLAIAALVIFRKRVLKDRTMLFWLIMFVASVLLATGTSSILAGPYSWFVLKAPGVSSLGWIFRAADRWLIYGAVFYALLLGLLIAWLLRDGEAIRTGLAVGAVAIVLVSFVPIALSYARDVYDPTHIPEDYAKVSAALEKMDPGRGAIWVPFARDGFKYSWAPKKRVGPFDVYTSNPSLNNLQDIFSFDNYYYWLDGILSRTDLGPGDTLNKGMMLPDDLATNLFMPLAGRYIVLDSSVPNYPAGQSIRNDRSLRSVLSSGDLEVFELAENVQPVRAASSTIVINNLYDLLAIAQRLTPEQFSRCTFTGSVSKAGERYGEVVMDKYLEPFDINSGFEKTGADGMPVGWTGVGPTGGRFESATDQSPKAEVSVDRSTKVGGKTSLKIENSSGDQLKVYSVSGPSVPVVPGDIYKLSSWVKYRNVDWTRVTIEGFIPGTGDWVPIVNCPVTQSGNSSWKNERCSFYMPAGISLVRPTLVGGWAKSAGRPGTSWFDDVEISRLGSGFYQQLQSAPEAPAVSFKRVSPEKYEVRVAGARRGFMLTFAQAFDRLWVARVEGGKPGDPIRLNSTINGFGVDRKGDFAMTVEYQPQGWFSAALGISLASLAFCLVYLLARTRYRRRVALPVPLDEPVEDTLGDIEDQESTGTNGGGQKL